MQTDNVRQQVREFVATNFYVPNPEELTDSMSLLESGIVDSTGLLEIILFLETTCGVKVEDDEILPENLDGIGRIAAYVARKTAGRAADCAA